MAEGVDTYDVGIDIGSTTLKMVAFDMNGKLIFADYHRHYADIKKTAQAAVSRLCSQVGEAALRIVMTGSVGMGYAKRLNVAFAQEVVAAAEMIKQKYPTVGTFIDMGGEDSKMIFLRKAKSLISA